MFAAAPLLGLYVFTPARNDQQFRMSNGEIISLVAVSHGTVHCDPELPLFKRILFQAQARGVFSRLSGSLLGKVLSFKTPTSTDILWFNVPRQPLQQVYLIARLHDENGEEFDIAHNFFVVPGKYALLMLPRSIPHLDRLRSITIYESDFPNNDAWTQPGNPGYQRSFFVTISAPERELATISAADLGLNPKKLK